MLLNINNKLNITLCGMMGSGKTAIGRILANKLDYNFIDVDKMIEIEAKKTIKKIFDEDGEEYFRDLEEKITINILKHKETIVSLGGGAIINNNIRNSIKKNLKKKLINLINKREKFYQKADLIIKNEKNIIETTENIIKKIIN